MKRMDGVLTVRRLLTAPLDHLRYRLELHGELRLSPCPQHAIRVELDAQEESDELQRARLRLSVEGREPALEEFIEFLPAPGDCWTLVEHFHPAPSLGVFASALAPILRRLASSPPVPAANCAMRSAA